MLATAFKTQKRTNTRRAGAEIVPYIIETVPARGATRSLAQRFELLDLPVGDAPAIPVVPSVPVDQLPRRAEPLPLERR